MDISLADLKYKVNISGICRRGITLCIPTHMYSVEYISVLCIPLSDNKELHRKRRKIANRR